MGLTAFGMLFMVLGILMLFDSSLLTIGNILFLGGLTLIIGVQKTIQFFARKQKLRGTVCFFFGVLLVLLKWAVIGMLVEGFGFVNLFGDFFPVIVSTLRRLPVVGTLLNLPGISNAVDRLSGSKLPV